MFTVIVGFDWSGNIKIRKPFGKRYSVMPSTDVYFSGAVTAAATEAVGVVIAGVGAGAAAGVVAGLAPFFCA